MCIRRHAETDVRAKDDAKKKYVIRPVFFLEASVYIFFLFSERFRSSRSPVERRNLLRKSFENLDEEPVIGKIYDGRVISIQPFGAFVQVCFTSHFHRKFTIIDTIVKCVVYSIH